MKDVYVGEYVYRIVDWYDYAWQLKEFNIIRSNKFEGNWETVAEFDYEKDAIKWLKNKENNND